MGQYKSMGTILLVTPVLHLKIVFELSDDLENWMSRLMERLSDIVMIS